MKYNKHHILLIAIIIIFSLIIIITSKLAKFNHIDEAKTPSGSSIMHGRLYEDVVESFEKNGFTNIKLEKIDDLIVGWLTKDGEVEKVLVGGDENYYPDQWVPANIEVVIYYHTFPVSENSSNSNKTETANNPTNNSDSVNITMPYSSKDYEFWLLEDVINNLNSLGFYNIQTVSCKPTDDNYALNIFDIQIATGLFSDDPWESGDKFASESKITIYYNEFPLLTVDNCPDLLTILTSSDISYTSFSKEYDDRYVKFDAHIVENISYMDETEHIIEVVGGNAPSNESDKSLGLKIRIGTRTWNNDVNTNHEENTNCTVIGKINSSWSEYYDMLYVEGLSLKPR